MAIAPMLPSAESFGAKARVAMSAPKRISVMPIRKLSGRRPKALRAHDMRGLFSTSGLMPIASYSVNFSAPTHKRMTTRP